MTTNESTLRKIPVVCLGAAVPSLMLGRSVMAGLVVVFVIAIAASRHWRAAVAGGLRRMVGDPLFFLAMLLFASWLPGLLASGAPLVSMQTGLRTAVFAVGLMPILSVLQADRMAIDLVVSA